MKNADMIDTFLIAGGVTVGMANIEQALGVAILVVQLVWLFVKLFYKCYAIYKETGTIEGADDDVDEFIDMMDEIRQNIARKEEETDGQSDKQE